MNEYVVGLPSYAVENNNVSYAIAFSKVFSDKKTKIESLAKFCVCKALNVTDCMNICQVCFPLTTFDCDTFCYAIVFWKSFSVEKNKRKFVALEIDIYVQL